MVKKKTLAAETAKKFQEAKIAIMNSTDEEYEATVAVVWRGLTQEEKDLLVDTLDAEVGPWRPLNLLSAKHSEVVRAADLGGYIPEYLAPNCRSGTGLRSEVERLRLQRFLQTWDAFGGQVHNHRQGYKR